MYDDDIVIGQDDDANGQLGILVKRILAKYTAAENQFFFQEKRDQVTGNGTGMKEPVRLYIRNAGENGEFPVQDITEVITSLTDTPSNFIVSNNKSRIKISFKIFLLVKHQDVVAPSLIVLPDDIGAKCTTQYDLTIPQHKSHDYPKEALQISDGNFMYVADIPLSEFDNQLTGNQLHDSTLKSHVVLKNLSWTVDVDDIVRNEKGGHSIPATSTTVAVFQDITDKISIDQDIIINGISNMF